MQTKTPCHIHLVNQIERFKAFQVYINIENQVQNFILFLNYFF